MTLKYLPPPPPNKTGWPWMEESSPLPHTMPDSSPWPRISIVTPSYNQAEFIEETIRSVLLQGYPNLEYTIIDGGSTDGSVDIIRKYEPWLTYWVSEPDSGQAEAINKGFQLATGEIVAWLNSDDTYERDAFVTVAEMAVQNNAGVLHGACKIIDSNSHCTDTRHGPTSAYKLWHYWLGYYGISQPATFFRKSLLTNIGLLNQEYHCALDYDLLLRASMTTDFAYTDKYLASFRISDLSKTASGWTPFEIEHGHMLLGKYRKQALDLWGDEYLKVVRKRYAEALLTRVCRSNEGPRPNFWDDLLIVARYDNETLFTSRFWKGLTLSMLGRQRYERGRDFFKSSTDRS